MNRLDKAYQQIDSLEYQVEQLEKERDELKTILEGITRVIKHQKEIKAILG